MKCVCAECPVQEESSCAADKNAAMEAGGETMPMPSAADFPGLYCANGKAVCDDLDFTQTCICMECPVYDDNGLRGSKYCERGSAAEVE
jgi:hypothetical protein